MLRREELPELLERLALGDNPVEEVGRS